MTDDELKAINSILTVMEGMSWENKTLVVVTALGVLAIEAPGTHPYEEHARRMNMKSFADVTGQTLMAVPGIYRSLKIMLAKVAMGIQ